MHKCIIYLMTEDLRPQSGDVFFSEWRSLKNPNKYEGDSNSRSIEFCEAGSICRVDVEGK
jgi:hypothetical protein